MATKDDPGIIERVRAEHNRLREIKAALLAALDRAPDDDPAAWLDDLIKKFEHYRAHLIHRVALTEIGGFLQVVLERRPTLSKQVDHLKQSHAEMIEMAGGTMKELRELDRRHPDSVRQAGLLVKMALSEVKYHEEAEQLLVSFVFTQETGVGD
ncbi:MAG TPA: hypothetical protein P5572_10815 [Phycisphaerae bacterium]|nr:hypothetical protein [Phycisphaerales bacterium]HRX85499.1 hypothetical protein [Phycisphaerae bacterium]